MGSVVSTIASAATKVYHWGVSCLQAAANFFKRIWQGFVNLMSRLRNFIVDQLSRVDDLYSNQTTAVSSPRPQGVTQRTVQHYYMQSTVEVRSDNQLENLQFLKIQEEKRKTLENMKAAKAVVDKTVEIMDKDVQAGNPAASEKSAVEIKKLMEGNSVQDIIAKMGSSPVGIAY